MNIKKKLRLIITIMAVLCLSLLSYSPALATNPTINMTVTAGVVNITNTQSTWALGTATLDEIIYFSATGAQDDDYSTVNNTGTLAVDIEIQGTDFEGGTYDWTLASVNGTEQYCLYANTGNGTATYNIEVKSLSYNDLTTNLGVGLLYNWSMKFTAPSAFNASEAGAQKTATVTLVASEHT